MLFNLLKLSGNILRSEPATRCIKNFATRMLSSNTITRPTNIVRPVSYSIPKFNFDVNPLVSIQKRQFHAMDSKIHYLDFRHRFRTNHLRLHLLIIRRQKMKKHRRTKFRKKFKCLLAKKRLQREIAKEKAFRVELLTIIRRAEQFDPKEYALRKIAEARNKPVEKTKEEKFEELRELIRINRYQTTYIKPRHKKSDALDILSILNG